MKNKFLKMTITAVFALIVGYTTYTSNRSDATLSDMMLNNVEALANESDTLQAWCCGNCCVCARGENIVIHGHAQGAPC